MRIFRSALVVGAIIIMPTTAQAKNILLSNDDGLSSNIVALYNALKAEGHDVIVSVPCMNQSGVGSAINMSTPQSKLTTACRSNAAQVGAPVAGPMTRPGINGKDFNYVLGTPVMSMLYGLDLAQQRWGRAPDVVMGGPNEGQNVGSIIVNSGTVNVAIGAAVRGVPAIAFSSGGNTADDANLANPLSAKVATLSVKFFRHVLARAGDGPVLPTGLVLNVNYPANTESAKWEATEVGTFNAYTFGYVGNVAKAASPEVAKLAKEHNLPLPDGPGLSVSITTTPPTADQADDESLVAQTNISVSPLQAGYQSPPMEGVATWLVSGLNGAGK